MQLLVKIAMSGAPQAPQASHSISERAWADYVMKWLYFPAV